MRYILDDLLGIVYSFASIVEKVEWSSLQLEESFHSACKPAHDVQSCLLVLLLIRLEDLSQKLNVLHDIRKSDNHRELLVGSQVKDVEVHIINVAVCSKMVAARDLFLQQNLLIDIWLEILVLGLDLRDHEVRVWPLIRFKQSLGGYIHVQLIKFLFNFVRR